MEEIKFVTLFPELESKITERQRNKTNLKTKKNFKKVPINILLYKEDFNFPRKKTELDFLKNKVKFYTPNITNNTKKIYNKTEFKYQNKMDTKNKFSRTVNIKKIIKNKENKPMIFKIFDKFDEVNKKYNEQTKYYNSLIKRGDNEGKAHINNFSNKLIKFPVLPKNNTKKHCSNVYQRIKSIQ